MRAEHSQVPLWPQEGISTARSLCSQDRSQGASVTAAVNSTLSFKKSKLMFLGKTTRSIY